MQITVKKLAEKIDMDVNYLKMKLGNYQMQKYVRYHHTRSPYSVILNKQSLEILERLVIPVNNTNSFKRKMKIKILDELREEVLKDVVEQPKPYFNCF